MGGKKPLKHCGYNRDHEPHVWTEDGKYGRKGRKLYCDARKPAEKHVHIWDNKQGMPVMRNPDTGLAYVLYSPYDESELWQGPVGCSCGKSMWLTDGKVEVRFPHGDALERLMALRAKLARGKEQWTDEDQAELERIGAALVVAMEPIVAALAKLGEQIALTLQGFFDRLDPKLLAELAEVAKSIGEKPDAVETVDLIGSDGKVVATAIVSHDPVAAVPPLSDEAQVMAIEEEVGYLADDPQYEPILDVAVAEEMWPHLEAKVNGMSFEIAPGQALVNGQVFEPSEIERKGLGHIGGIGHQDLANRLRGLSDER